VVLVTKLTHIRWLKPTEIGLGVVIFAVITATQEAKVLGSWFEAGTDGVSTALYLKSKLKKQTD
jgi:hypothetical protein